MSVQHDEPRNDPLSRIFTERRKERVRLLLASMKKIAKQFRKSRGGMLGVCVLAFFVLTAVFAPWISRYDDPNDEEWARVNPSFHPPSLDFLFGTDHFGRDVFSLTWYGARASLIVGVVASLISIILGTVIGLCGGYFGKLPDEILMRLTDFFLVIPWFPLMIVIASLLGRSFTNVIIVIGITSWPSTARIVRAQVLSVKEKGFVERARSVGAGSARIISRHIMPNVLPLVFANTTLLIANSIFSESFLDFFGLGDPTVVSWGTMLEEAYNWEAFARFSWWQIGAPGACIVALIMAFYLIGEALDDVMNPKLRRR
jgi:peptide/nickel transport system permease protein